MSFITIVCLGCGIFGNCHLDRDPIVFRHLYPQGFQNGLLGFVDVAIGTIVQLIDFFFGGLLIHSTIITAIWRCPSGTFVNVVANETSQCLLPRGVDAGCLHLDSWKCRGCYLCIPRRIAVVACVIPRCPSRASWRTSLRSRRLRCTRR